MESARKSINAKQAAADMRSGMTDLELMRKYDISPKALLSLSAKLATAGYLTEEELAARQPKRPAPKPAHSDPGDLESGKPRMCPACGASNDGAKVCGSCGVVIEKYRSIKSHAPIPSDSPSPMDTHGDPAETDLNADEETEDEEFIPEPRLMEKEQWIMLGSGALVGLLCFLTFWTTWIPMTFRTLVHEMGHAIFGWMYGYPSIPAFDMLHGGGVTLHIERSGLMVALIFGALFWVMYVYRRNTATVTALGCLILLHAVFSYTSAHDAVIVFMGHGMELLIAAVFIYRALSGRRILHPWERPLYGVLGFFLVFANIGMAWSILTDLSYREEYIDAKECMDMDFVRLARDSFHTRLDSVLKFFLVLCPLAPLAAYLIFRYEQYIYYGLSLLLRRDPHENDA